MPPAQATTPNSDLELVEERAARQLAEERLSDLKALLDDTRRDRDRALDELRQDRDRWAEQAAQAMRLLPGPDRRRWWWQRRAG